MTLVIVVNDADSISAKLATDDCKPTTDDCKPCDFSAVRDLSAENGCGRRDCCVSEVTTTSGYLSFGEVTNVTTLPLTRKLASVVPSHQVASVSVTSVAPYESSGSPIDAGSNVADASKSNTDHLRVGTSITANHDTTRVAFLGFTLSASQIKYASF